MRNKRQLPHLRVEDITLWAQAYHERIGTWPTAHSGPIVESQGETWAAVHAALSTGLRGLPGGDTLARLLAREFGRRNARNAPPLCEETIKEWIRQHRAATGQWPVALSGEVRGVPGETWMAISLAMYRGRRSMSGKVTLSALVAAVKNEHRSATRPRPERA